MLVKRMKRIIRLPAQVAITGTYGSAKVSCTGTVPGTRAVPVAGIASSPMYAKRPTAIGTPHNLSNLVHSEPSNRGQPQPT